MCLYGHANKARCCCCGHKNKISLYSDLPKEIHACPVSVFEVNELCRTRADILKPMHNRTLVASQITEI